jgi:hypothetical protein
VRQTAFHLGRFTALLALGVPVLIAQGVQTGDLSGSVMSADGKLLPGATIRIETSRGTRTGVSDDKGTFRFPLLVVGPVKVTATAPGYVGSSVTTNVSLGRTEILDFKLRPQQEAGAIVAVVASTSAVDTTEVKDGKNTTMLEVENLPINNRAVGNLLLLTPGTSTDANGQTIRGSQNTQVQYVVDGVDIQDTVTGGTGLFMNEDMIQEMQVVTGGASADYGRFTGGSVNVVTKSGGNEFEGLARYQLTNPVWNAYNPMQRVGAGFQNHTSTTQNYTFSGPIWKDHLWFIIGYRTVSPTQLTARYTTAPAVYGGNQLYYLEQLDTRKDIKLDWQITPDHRVYVGYNFTDRGQKNRDYASFAGGGGSTSLQTLSDQPNTYGYTTVGWVGTFGSNLGASVRYGDKKEQLGGSTGGGVGPRDQTMMFDLNTGHAYDNGYFGPDGDQRPVRNATAFVNWFGNGLGEHQVKVGVDWFESKRNAANSQSPNNMIIGFNGWKVDPTNGGSLTDINNRVFDVNSPGSTYLTVYVPAANATTKNTTTSFYVNDKWKLDAHWSFNLGLRYDASKSVSDIGAQNYSASTLSPRLTAMYDLKGDGSWVVSANYDIYSGLVNQGSTDNASGVGNPGAYSYTYVAGDPEKRSSWSTAAFSTFDPGKYRSSNTIDPNLKPPSVRELSVTVKHADGKGGSWSATAVKRTWMDGVDDFYSINPHPVDANDNVLQTIKNDPTMVREYLGFEFQYSKQFNEKFSMGGNLTLSELKGNYEGGQVGTTGAANNFGPYGLYANGPTRDQLEPYGFLRADVPLVAQAWGNYLVTLGKGRLSFGFFANFTSGAPYSTTAVVALPSTVPAALGSTYTRYFGARGNYRFPNQYNTNLQVSYDLPVYKKMAYFLRANITNLFNHQLMTSYTTSGNAYVLSGSSYIKDTGNSSKAVFLPSSTFGKAASGGNFLNGRQVTFVTGIRF